MKTQPITRELIALASRDAKRSGRPVVDELRDALSLPEAELIESLGALFQYPLLSSRDMAELQPDFERVPYQDALLRECLGFEDAEGQLGLAIADPFDADLMAWGEARHGRQVVWYLAHRNDILACLSRFEESMNAIGDTLIGAVSSASVASGVEELSLRSISEDSSPVVRLVNSALYDALNSDVSDIHLETGNNKLTIKNRIDGVLTVIGEVQGGGIAEQVISRIKILAELDIGERRIPQDGRFKVSIKGREVDFRVSIMPSIFGEDAALRVLDKKSLANESNTLRLDALGYEGEMLARIRKLAAEPYGMVLVTGPTGSGKTTTLYAMISEINRGLDKIITIEDPVEYQLSGVLQIPVNEKKGLTFARGLRSILRHDPDKIMVGEVRDPETAEIAVQAALTGHLVFTTVHANNVFDVISRFLHMGVDTYSFVSAINGVLAQRLLRLNCPACSRSCQPGDEELSVSGLRTADVGNYRFMKGAGCDHCRNTGYRGRKAISELLLFGDDVREMILAREPIRHIKEAACRNGTIFLREAALELVRRGETTLEEINRVTFVA